MIIALPRTHTRIRGSKMLESAAHVGLQAADGPLSLDRFGAESARIGRGIADQYHRYHIETEEVDDADPLPHLSLIHI